MFDQTNQLMDAQTTFVTIPEAAQLIRVSQRTIYRWVRDSRLRCFRLGNVTRVAVADLKAFIEENSKHDSH